MEAEANGAPALGERVEHRSLVAWASLAPGRQGKKTPGREHLPACALVYSSWGVVQATSVDAGLIVLGYLIGSFPSAYLATKLFGGGRDIRKVGSGNVGGMNALRNVSPAAGAATAVVDFGKGVLAVYLATRFGTWTYTAVWAAAAVVTGHNFMLFLGFKGGKGLGATAGAFAYLSWPVVLWFGGAILAASLASRDTNFGSGLAAVFLPLILWLSSGRDPMWLAAGAALGLVIAAKHWPDARAYLKGRRQLM